MKKVFIVIAALGISAFNITNLYAQNTADYAKRTFRFSAALASAENDELFVTAHYLNDVNVKAVRTFQKMYKDARNVFWSESNGTIYSRFTANGTAYRNFFTKKGSWIGGIQTYGEEKLPREVRAVIKPIYYDYAITLVDEVSLPDQQPVYVVHIEDNNSIKNIAIQNGETRVLDEFEKSN